MISKAEVFLQALKFLHMDQEVDEIKEIMESCYRKVEEKIIPRVVMEEVSLVEWSRHPFYFDMESKDLEDILKEGRSIIFLGATLGVESERLLLETQVKDPLYGLVMDAILSSTVEVVLNERQEELQRQVLPLYVTDRFSPGYGDLSMDLQKSIGKILNIPKRLGVRFNESGIMIPRKSVLAICGVQESMPEYRHRGCESCKLRDNCELRGKGRRCSRYGE